MIVYEGKLEHGFMASERGRRYYAAHLANMAFIIKSQRYRDCGWRIENTDSISSKLHIIRLHATKLANALHAKL